MTNTKEIIDGAQVGLPIYYEAKKAPKEKINKDILYKSDMNGFNQKIGFVTNCATSGFSLLPTLEENTPEYLELIDRLKRFRKEQGNNIDATKGIVIKPFPDHWTKWKRIPKDISESEKEFLEFENRIVINKRPLFMRWLYKNYNQKHNDFITSFSGRARMRFDKTIEQILLSAENDLSEDELNLKSAYYKQNPFIETACVMNKVSRYMELNIKQIRNESNRANLSNAEILRNKLISCSKDNVKKIYDLYLEYKKEKRNFSAILDFDGGQKYKTIEQYNKNIKQRAYQIVSNGQELANIAVDICYTIHPNDNKSFVWNVFGDEIIENIKTNSKRTYNVPFYSNDGDIEFLGERYRNYELELRDE